MGLFSFFNRGKSGSEPGKNSSEPEKIPLTEGQEIFRDLQSTGNLFMVIDPSSKGPHLDLVQTPLLKIVQGIHITRQEEMKLFLGIGVNSNHSSILYEMLRSISEEEILNIVDQVPEIGHATRPKRWSEKELMAFKKNKNYESDLVNYLDSRNKDTPEVMKFEFTDGSEFIFAGAGRVNVYSSEHNKVNIRFSEKSLDYEKSPSAYWLSQLNVSLSRNTLREWSAF